MSSPDAWAQLLRATGVCAAFACTGVEVPGRDIQKCEDAPGFNFKDRAEVVRVSASKGDAFQVVLVENGRGMENWKKPLELGGAWPLRCMSRFANAQAVERGDGVDRHLFSECE